MDKPKEGEIIIKHIKEIEIDPETLGRILNGENFPCPVEVWTRKQLEEKYPRMGNAEEEETWKPIQGYPNYVVSQKGRVKNIKNDLVLKHHKSKRGGFYAFVNLYKNGARKNVLVHKLVSEIFIGPRPKGMEVHHRNGNRMDPDVTNLEYVTHKQNCMLRSEQSQP